MRQSHPTYREAYVIQDLNGRERADRSPIIGPQLATVHLRVLETMNKGRRQHVKVLAESDFGSGLSAKPWWGQDRQEDTHRLLVHAADKTRGTKTIKDDSLTVDFRYHYRPGEIAVFARTGDTRRLSEPTLVVDASTWRQLLSDAGRTARNGTTFHHGFSDLRQALRTVGHGFRELRCGRVHLGSGRREA